MRAIIALTALTHMHVGARLVSRQAPLWHLHGLSCSAGEDERDGLMAIMRAEYVEPVSTLAVKMALRPSFSRSIGARGAAAAFRNSHRRA